MDEATVLDAVIRYFNSKGAVLFVDPGSDESYDKVRTTVCERPNCGLNDSITIASRTPDLVGILGRNELIAVEAKGDKHLRKGIGQATDYRRGVHKSYLAAEASALTAFDDAAHAAGVGTIPVGENGVISSQVRAPSPQIAGTEIDSTRRALAVNYPTLLAHGLRRSLLEGRASCFHDALCRYGCIHRERSLHRR
ncbi:hypothetical protein KZ498_14470, partial [Haloarcula sp. 1CSR25-25]|nr:hypothetical protein [Haloarcula sp. 1CSR25-25]